MAHLVSEKSKNLFQSQKSTSCEKQDVFVYSLLPIVNGTFLEVACGHPVDCNNTFLLESETDWNGISVDIGDVEKAFQWSKVRKAKFCRVDATSEALTWCIKANLDNLHVDYLSLDVDFGPSTNLTHFALSRVLNAGVSFKCCTLEHEAFKYGPSNRDFTRKLLHDRNYIMLFESVSFPNGSEWEDWWIDPKYFNQDVLNLKSSNITYTEAVEKVRSLNQQTLI